VTFDSLLISPTVRITGAAVQFQPLTVTDSRMISGKCTYHNLEIESKFVWQDPLRTIVFVLCFS